MQKVTINGTVFREGDLVDRLGCPWVWRIIQIYSGEDIDPFVLAHLEPVKKDGTRDRRKIGHTGSLSGYRLYQPS